MLGEGRSGRSADGLDARCEVERSLSGRRPDAEAVGAVRGSVPDVGVGGREPRRVELPAPAHLPARLPPAMFCFIPIPGRRNKALLPSNAEHVRPEILKDPQQVSVTTFWRRQGN